MGAVLRTRRCWPVGQVEFIHLLMVNKHLSMWLWVYPLPFCVLSLPFEVHVSQKQLCINYNCFICWKTCLGNIYKSLQLFLKRTHPLLDVVGQSNQMDILHLLTVGENFLMWAPAASLPFQGGSLLFEGHSSQHS